MISIWAPRRIPRVALMLAVLVPLAGCTGSPPTPGAAGDPTPSSSGAGASIAPTVTTAPVASAVEPTPRESFPDFPTLPPAAERVVVYGNLDCGIENISQANEGETTVYRGTLVCRHQMSDPRVSGLEESDMTVVYLQTPGLEMDKWIYPTGRLTNDGGTWRASGWGSEFWDEEGENLRTSGTSYYLGEGGYAGLVYRLLYAQGPETAPYGYLAAGWIEPAE